MLLEDASRFGARMKEDLEFRGKVTQAKSTEKFGPLPRTEGMVFNQQGLAGAMAECMAQMEQQPAGDTPTKEAHRSAPSPDGAVHFHQPLHRERIKQETCHLFSSSSSSSLPMVAATTPFGSTMTPLATPSISPGPPSRISISTDR